MSERGYESACKVWNGKDLLPIFHNLGITADIVSIMKVHQISTPIHSQFKQNMFSQEGEREELN